MSTRACFVVMPFGQKFNLDGRVIDALKANAERGTSIDPAITQPIDFDAVYTEVITPAITNSNHDLVPVRCDQIPGAGSIHEDMFRHIHECDVVVVDISTLNANVFYELGIRHTLTRSVTVLIQRKGTQAPFNISGFRVIDYDETDPADAITTIAAFIDEGLGNKDRNDSPVHKHLPDLVIRERLRPIIETERIEYEVTDRPGTRIGLITGNLENIKGIDVWVNSENTNMQMARFHERGVSSVIRWLGAEKKRSGRLKKDTIADELRAIMDEDGEVETEAGVVLTTGSGELARTHQVKRVFHAAAVDGQVNQGYEPIPDLSVCVRAALALMDAPELEGEGLETILFPLMGTGNAGGSIAESMEMLVDTSLAFLDNNPRTSVKGVYVIARIPKHRDSGIAVLDARPRLRRCPPQQAEPSAEPGA